MPTSLFRALICFAVGTVAPSLQAIAAQDKLPAAFTQEQIQEMARNYIDVIEEDKESTLDAALQMSQFFGYVMGHLDSGTRDSDQEAILTLCTAKSPKLIVLRTARTLSTSKLDRTASVRDTVRIALGLSCDERFWAKEQ